MNDIPKPKGIMWTLPVNFAGYFVYPQNDYTDALNNEEKPVYNYENDTIYIYHQYQMMIMSENASEEPAMTLDYMNFDAIYNDGTYIIVACLQTQTDSTFKFRNYINLIMKMSLMNGAIR